MGAEPAWFHWLRVAGEAAGIVLVIELLLVLLITCALMVALWLAFRWVRINVVPLVDQYGEQAQRALSVAVRGGDRIVDGVAQLHGRQEAIKAAVYAFVFGANGRGGAHNGGARNGSASRSAAHSAAPTDAVMEG